MKRLFLLAAMIAATGLANAADDEKKFHFVDLRPYANQQRGDNMGSGVEGNNLAKLPGGQQTFAKVKFKVEQGIVQLGSTIVEPMPEKVTDIKVDGKCSKLHFLHATCFGGGPNVEGSPLFVKDGTLIGEYRVKYEDESSFTIPIVYGQDVRDWFYRDGEMVTERGQIAWNGKNDRAAQVGAKIRLYLTTWKNPKPEKNVVSIDYLGKKSETVAAPFCVAVSFEE